MEWDGPTSRLRTGGWLGNRQPHTPAETSPTSPTPPSPAPAPGDEAPAPEKQAPAPARPGSTPSGKPPAPAGDGPVGLDRTGQDATVVFAKVDGPTVALPSLSGPAVASPGRRSSIVAAVAAVAALVLAVAATWWIGRPIGPREPAFVPLRPPLTVEPFVPPPGSGPTEAYPPETAPPPPGGDDGGQEPWPRPTAGGQPGQGGDPRPRPSGGPAGAVLSIAEQQVPPVVDLTAEGGVDWVHWGLLNPGWVQRRRGGPGVIVDLGGAGVRGRYDSNPQRFKWWDGTPIGVEFGTPTGVYTCGVNSGFTIAVPAGAGTRTLRFYAGLWMARGRLDVTLGGQSQTRRLEDRDGIATRRWVITFRAPAGTRLLVRWTAEATYEPRCGNVDMQAAALAEAG